MARPLNLVNETLTQMEGSSPVLHSVHTDDVAQECHGSTGEVFHSLAEAGGCFIAATQAMGLEISSTSVILLSSKPLQNSLIRFFRTDKCRCFMLGRDKEESGIGDHG